MRRVAILLLTSCVSRPLPPAASGPVVGAPTHAATTQPATETPCPPGGYVVITDRPVEEPHQSIALRCDEAELHMVIDAPLVKGEPAHEGSYDSFVVSRETADALWRVVVDAEWVRWRSCEPGTGPRYEVEIDDGQRRRLVHCEGRLPTSWARVRDALRTEAHWPAADFETLWPFGDEWNGDYWRDELGYYRAGE